MEKQPNQDRQGKEAPKFIATKFRALAPVTLNNQHLYQVPLHLLDPDMISEHPAYQQTISDLRNGFDDADAMAANFPRAVYAALSYDTIAIYKLLE